MSLTSTGKQVATWLAENERRLVLAESCTAGLIAATLAGNAGISEFLCGSAVTYRNATKHEWLGVSTSDLRRPGPVSRKVARQMAEGVVRNTPEADLGLAVTGHLGPDAPARLDGTVHLAVAKRGRDQIELVARKVQLIEETRLRRQREAAEQALLFLLETGRKRSKRSP